MKILLVNYGYLPDIGGLVVLIHELATNLVRRGHEVTVVSSNTVNFKPAKLPEHEYIEGVRVRRLNSYQILPYKWLFFTPAIITTIIREKVDIVHVFSYLPIFMNHVACLVSKFKRAPLVITPSFHPQRSIYYSGFLQKTLMPFYDKVLGMSILKSANAVIAQTNAEFEFYRAHGVKNVNLLPVGLVLNQKDEEVVTASERQRFKEKFYLSNGKMILAVGGIERRKGFDLLVKAFLRMYDAIPNSKLLVVGKDIDSRGTLEQLAQSLGIGDAVIFTGPLSNKELYCAYEVADAVVQSSRFEAFCKVGLEAWLHKKPIVVFDRFHEPITPETGILVKHLDIDALAEAMIRLLSDLSLAQRLGQNGYELLTEKYDWDKTVDKFEGLYNSLKN